MLTLRSREGLVHMVYGSKLLIIDDDQVLTHALQLYLAHAGYQVILAANGPDGLQRFYSEHPDLVILDIQLPQLDGWQVCRRIRDLCDVPIVMLTACSQPPQRVSGLKMGADDYVVKPFSLKELEARIDAILRRTSRSRQGAGHIVYSDDALTISSDQNQVWLRGALLSLTRTELRLLLLLAENSGRLVTHRQMLQQVWGPEYIDDIDYTKRYICQLRQKIEDDPSDPQYIVTERGLGYRFCRRAAQRSLVSQPLPQSTP
jgi:DNA-binding response OmpR family regulator